MRSVEGEGVDVFGCGVDELGGSEGCFLLGLGLDGPGEEGEGGEEIVVAEVVGDVIGEEAAGAVEGAGELKLFPDFGGFR